MGPCGKKWVRDKDLYGLPIWARIECPRFPVQAHMGYIYISIWMSMSIYKNIYTDLCGCLCRSVMISIWAHIRCLYESLFRSIDISIWIYKDIHVDLQSYLHRSIRIYNVIFIGLQVTNFYFDSLRSWRHSYTDPLRKLIFLRYHLPAGTKVLN